MVCGMKPIFLSGLALAGMALFSACEKQPYSTLEAMTSHAHHGDEAHGDDKGHAKDHETKAAPAKEEAKH